MNKELTPLEAFNEFLNIIDVPVKSHLLNFNDAQTLERYRVLRTQIEDALKDYDILRQFWFQMGFKKFESKYLLDMISQDKQELSQRARQIEKLTNQSWKNEKKLKALKIIKRKNIDMWIISHSNSVEEFNDKTLSLFLTQEEFDLLKEVLREMTQC